MQTPFLPCDPLVQVLLTLAHNQLWIKFKQKLFLKSQWIFFSSFSFLCQDAGFWMQNPFLPCDPLVVTTHAGAL